MRKNAKYILATLLLLCVTTSVNAEECDYAKQVELNNEASTVKAIYEETEIDTGMKGVIESDPSQEVAITEKGFTLKVLNLSKNIYVTVNNNYTGESKDYYYQDTKDGTLILGTFVADQVYTYDIIVKASNEKDSECQGKELRNIKLMTPRYNYFSELAICEEYPNFEYCQEYSTSLNEIGTVEFYDKLEKYEESNKSKTEIEKEQTKEKNEKNKKNIMIIVGCIVLAGVATTAIIVIRRRSRLI